MQIGNDNNVTQTQVGSDNLANANQGRAINIFGTFFQVTKSLDDEINQDQDGNNNEADADQLGAGFFGSGGNEINQTQLGDENFARAQQDAGASRNLINQTQTGDNNDALGLQGSGGGISTFDNQIDQI